MKIWEKKGIGLFGKKFENQKKRKELNLWWIEKGRVKKKIERKTFLIYCALMRKEKVFWGQKFEKLFKKGSKKRKFACRQVSLVKLWRIWEREKKKRGGESGRKKREEKIEKKREKKCLLWTLRKLGKEKKNK